MGRLPFLVLLYVMLDFANPLMPGAVGFSGGSVEVVQGDRTGRATAAAVPAPTLVSGVTLLPGDGVLVRPTPVPPVARARPHRIARGAVAEASESPISSSEAD